MRWFIGVLLSGLLGLASAGVAVAGPSGGVYLVTLPTGADIWMDGVYCGRSPVLVDALAEGRHSVTLTKTGWNVLEARVDVSGGSVALWSTKLTSAGHAEGKQIGSVTLRGLPKPAPVSIDGAPPRKVSKPVALTEGPHTVTFTGAHGSVTRSFTVLPDMTSELLLRDEGAAPVVAERAGVIVPAGDYLPPEAVTEQGKNLVIHYQGHEVIAHLDRVWMRVDGKALSYNSAPTTINGKLYLPLDLLDLITK